MYEFSSIRGPAGGLAAPNLCPQRTNGNANLGLNFAQAICPAVHYFYSADLWRFVID